MKIRVFITLLWLLAGLSYVRAQQATFQSSILQKLATEIHYSPCDTLTAGLYDAGNVQGLPLIVEYDNKHVITHIGFKLFSNELKKNYTSEVYHFLERYFLELCFCKEIPIKQKMSDDKVFFTLGTISDIKYINDSTQFSISRTENKFYEATWSNKGNTFMSIAFPIQYELLLGMPQAEIEQKLFDLIANAPEYTNIEQVSEYELVRDNVYRTKPSKHYEVESLNTSEYYYLKDAQYELVLDTNNMQYAATNVFHTLTHCNNPIRVSQSTYGFKKRDYIVNLKQWISYCKESNLTIYTAIEEEYSDGYKVLILAENQDIGYNHILSILVPKDFLSNPNGEFTGKLNAYIPTHNVKNLYQQHSIGKKKNISYK